LGSAMSTSFGLGLGFAETGNVLVFLVGILVD